MSPFEILAGPITLYLAPVGTVFPLVTALPLATWVRVGTNGTANYDDDGVTVSHVVKQEITRSAGRTGPIKAWNTEEDLMISLKLMDVSLEAYSIALNQATITTTAAGVAIPGTKRIGLSQGGDIAICSLLARGLSPYGDNFAAQYEVPRVFQSANQKPVFKKGKPAILELEFTALENLAAVSEEERFGRLVAQHQAAL